VRKRIPDDFKSGFVAIIGKPNVGKSTLLNRIMGEKLSIVSPRPQTTRHSIKGIYTSEKEQIVFLDTPGFVEARYELHHNMINAIESSLIDADLIIFMTDNHFPTDYDERVVAIVMKRVKVPKIAVINKDDLFDDEYKEATKNKLLEAGFDRVVTMSALNDEELSDFISDVTAFLPYSPPYYDKDNLSDMPVKFFAQEIIREQIFHMFREEIPYSSTVTIESFKEFDNKVEISANIWLERKSQKIILIGEKGSKIKEIRQASEKGIYELTGKRVKLELWVKIKQDWRKKSNALKEFGY